MDIKLCRPSIWDAPEGDLEVQFNVNGLRFHRFAFSWLTPGVGPQPTLFIGLSQVCPVTKTPPTEKL